MNNFINVQDEDGNISRVEVLDIFNVSGYAGKDYIMYSRGENVDNDNEKVYISILKDLGDENYSLDEIIDEKEWADVEEAVNELTGGDTNE